MNKQRVVGLCRKFNKAVSTKHFKVENYSVILDASRTCAEKGRYYTNQPACVQVGQANVGWQFSHSYPVPPDVQSAMADSGGSALSRKLLSCTHSLKIILKTQDG